VPLADPGIVITKKCLTNYSSAVKSKPGHGMGPAFLHSFNEYAKGVAADPLFAKLPQGAKDEWNYMLEKIQMPIHVADWVKGFMLKDMHGKIKTNVAVTFCLGKAPQREALLQFWVLKKYEVRVGPPPAGPLERKLQKTLERLIGNANKKKEGE
jgi:hypothetical protein